MNFSKSNPIFGKIVNILKVWKILQIFENWKPKKSEKLPKSQNSDHQSQEKFYKNETL